MARKKPTFEEALKRAEELAERIETGQIGLEESIKAYEEGISLLKHCREVLARAEMRIEKLHINEHGQVQREPFQTPDEASKSKTTPTQAASTTPPADPPAAPEPPF